MKRLNPRVTDRRTRSIILCLMRENKASLLMCCQKKEADSDSVSGAYVGADKHTVQPLEGAFRTCPLGGAGTGLQGAGGEDVVPTTAQRA